MLLYPAPPIVNRVGPHKNQVFQERKVDPVMASEPSRPVASGEEPNDLALNRRNAVYSASQQKEKRRVPLLYAEQIMQKELVCIGAQESVDRAKQLFKRHGFRHLPVISERSRLIGIVSDRNVFHSEIPLGGKRIAQVMSQRVYVAYSHSSIRDVAAIMCKEKIGAVPIVGSKDELIGIVSRSDILSTLTNHAPIELWS